MHRTYWVEEYLQLILQFDNRLLFSTFRDKCSLSHPTSKDQVIPATLGSQCCLLSFSFAYINRGRAIYYSGNYLETDIHLDFGGRAPILSLN